MFGIGFILGLSFSYIFTFQADSGALCCDTEKCFESSSSQLHREESHQSPKGNENQNVTNAASTICSLKEGFKPKNKHSTEPLNKIYCNRKRFSILVYKKSNECFFSIF